MPLLPYIRSRRFVIPLVPRPFRSRDRAPFADPIAKRSTSLFPVRLSSRRIYPQVQHALTSHFRRAYNSSCTFFRHSFIIRNGTLSFRPGVPACSSGDVSSRPCLSAFAISFRDQASRSRPPEIGVLSFPSPPAVFANALTPD